MIYTFCFLQNNLKIYLLFSIELFFRNLNEKITEEKTILTAKKQNVTTTVLKKQKYDAQCQVIVAGKY